MFSNGYNNILEEIDCIQKILPFNIVSKIIKYNEYLKFDYPITEFEFINKKIPKFKYKKLLKLIEHQTFISCNLYFLEDLKYHLESVNQYLETIDKDLDHSIKFSNTMAYTINSNITTTTNPVFISTQTQNNYNHYNKNAYVSLGLEMNIINHKTVSLNNEAELLKLITSYPEDLINYIIENRDLIDSFNRSQTFSKATNGLIISALKFNPKLINICGNLIPTLLHSIPQVIDYLTNENFNKYINKDYYKYLYLLNINKQLGMDLILSKYNSKYEIPFGILTNKEWAVMSLNYA